MRRKLLIILITVLSFNSLKSQSDTLYYLVSADSLPVFLYGAEQYKRFIQTNLTYPEEARRNNTQGTVYVSFVVDTFGKANNIKILKDIGSGCGNEAISVIKQSSGIWKPGFDKGKKVNVLLNLPIKFTCLNCPQTGGSSINMDPNYFAKYFFDRANDEEMAGRLLTAILYYTKALEYKPFFKDAFLKRGSVKFKNNDKKGACNDWLNAKKNGASNVEELINQNCK